MNSRTLVCSFALVAAAATVSVADDDDDDADTRPVDLVASPHASGGKLAAQLAKLDDPAAEKSFKSQDEDDRWRYVRQSLADPWSDFKKKFGLQKTAKATIDGDSFEADWFKLLKKDPHATLTGPDYWCQKPFMSNGTDDITWVLQQSKSCMAALKSIKAFTCVDDPKQNGLAKFELKKDGTLVFTVHDPHVASSAQDYSAMLEGYASVLPACQKIVDKTLNR